MFRCEACKQLSTRGESAVRVVVEIRDKQYPEREKAMRTGRGDKRRWISDPGGFGFETVREEIRHSRCV